jgi:hypothetical protein
MKATPVRTVALVLALGLGGTQAFAHANACHRGYIDKGDTVEFYRQSFKASEILHIALLRDRMVADNNLELGVLADIRGEPSEGFLDKALAALRSARQNMDALYRQIEVLREFDKTHKYLPEHEQALERILKNSPKVERVSLTNSRFANISQSKEVVTNFGTIGATFDELLANLGSDLKVLEKMTDDTIDAFVAVMPLAKNGGFAAMVLSGRAPLPEHIMHTVDQTMVYAQFFNRACMTSISADMQVYPKGFEWLPKVDWKRTDVKPK